MGVSHDELFRLLPRVTAQRHWRRDGNCIAIAVGGGRVELRVADEDVRRIGRFQLPVTRLEFRFFDVADTDRRAFMQRFDRAFHKGGG